MQALRIELAGVGGIGENALDLTGKAHSAADLRKEQRLGPDRIPREDQTLVDAIPEPDRKNAFEAGKERVPPGEIAGRQQLGVAMRAEHRSEIVLQFGAELHLVIDLAIIGDGDPTARIAHRLASRLGQVANGKPPVREADRAVVPDFPGVRSAVQQRGVHPLQHGAFDAAAVEIENACDATHALRLYQI